MIEVVEQLGSEILLDMKVGDGVMVASVEPTVRVKVRDKLRLAMRPVAAARVRRQDRSGDLNA